MPNKIDALFDYHGQLTKLITIEVDANCFWPDLTDFDTAFIHYNKSSEASWQARASFSFVEARSQAVHRITGKKGYFSPDTLIVPFVLMGAYNAYSNDNIEECLNITKATEIGAKYSLKSEDTIKRMIHRNTGPDKLFTTKKDGRNVFLIPTPAIRRTHFIASLVRFLDRQLCEEDDVWGVKFNNTYWTKYLKFDRAIYDFALRCMPPDTSDINLKQKKNKRNNIMQIASSFGDGS